MSDYISKEDAITAACKGFCHPGVRCPETSCMEQTKYLRGLPPADVVPVVHGYWFVDERPESDRRVTCSVCEEPVFRYLDPIDWRPKYCPHCGAEMDEYCPYCGAEMDGGDEHADVDT